MTEGHGLASRRSCLDCRAMATRSGLTNQPLLLCLAGGPGFGLALVGRDKLRRPDLDQPDGPGLTSHDPGEPKTRYTVTVCAPGKSPAKVFI